MAHESASPPTRRRTLLVLVMSVLALAVAIPVAWASHQFTDVPDAGPFHGDIGAVRDAGITSGKTCDPPGTPPTFCPGESITREAMAAFMHRGLGRTGYGEGGAPLTDAPTDLAIVVIDVGGVPGGTQFVQLHGAAAAFVGMDETECPCTSEFLLDEEGGDIGLHHFVTNDQPGPGGHVSEVALNGVVQVPAGTTQTFRLRGLRSLNTGGSVISAASLTATVVPFGNTGGSTLGTTATGTLEGTPFNPTR